MTFADLSPVANHLWQSTFCAAVVWLADASATEEPRCGALLALVGGVGKVPDPFLVAGQRGNPSGMASGARHRALAALFSDGSN